MKNLTTKLSLLAVSSMLVATTASAATYGRDTQITGTQYLNMDGSAAGQSITGGTFDGDASGSKAFKITDYTTFTSPVKSLNPVVASNPTITAGGANDVADPTKHDFKSHTASTTIPTTFGMNINFPYTSVYKTFGTDAMTIGHVDGIATLGASNIPSSGVAVMGYASTDMKTSGSNTYKGDATIRTLGANKTIQYGTSSVDVNFTNKTAQVHTKFANADGTYRNIFVDNTINGNKFSGTGVTDAAKKALMSAADQAKPFTVSGGFYGTDVGFVGGVYTNGNQPGNEIGTFGATKVSKITPLVK